MKNEAETARLLEISSANLTDFKMLRRFITPKMLYLAFQHLQISPNYILCGINERFKSHLDENKIEPYSKYQQLSYNKQPRINDIERAYVIRESLWQYPSINPQSFRSSPCFYDESTLYQYLSTRGDSKFLTTDIYEYHNGDPRDIYIITKTDFFKDLNPGQNLLLLLMADPYWFWPDSTYYYLISLIPNEYLIGWISVSEDFNTMKVSSLNGTEQLINRKEIQSVWRIERWGFFN